MIPRSTSPGITRYFIRISVKSKSPTQRAQFLNGVEQTTTKSQ